ncbi:MAG: hypothetical protein GOV15_04175 [Candidatus Diapherotrites archaeon]|nr:hypothetical protein [Candidatus Diapherotrites archaeon]
MEVEVNEDLAEFIGALMGDGFTARYKQKKGYIHTTQLSGHPTEDLDYYKKVISSLFLKLFNRKPRLYVHERALRAVINSKEAHEYLVKTLNFPSGKKGQKLKIPEKLLANKNLKQAVLRGLFDTDGFIYLDNRKIYKKPYPRIGITTISKLLIAQLEEIFKELGFQYYLRSEKRKECYHIEVYGHKQVDRWFKEIKPSNSKHLNKYGC